MVLWGAVPPERRAISSSRTCEARLAKPSQTDARSTVIKLMATLVSLETLPVELIASILAELDVVSLRRASETCARLRAVASDALLNPWRSPILRALTRRSPAELRHISVLSTVPRQNWIDILCYASPEFLLFEATPPNLTEDQYKIAFRKRFLPSWAKIRKSGPWREAFLKCVRDNAQVILCLPSAITERYSQYITA